MSAIVRFYRRLDLMQQRMWFKITAAIIMLAIVGGYLGSVISLSADLSTQHTVLRESLRDQGLADRDEHAVQFAQTGTVIVNGREYGGEWFRQRAVNYFSSDGTLDGRRLAAQFIGSQRPSWAPSWMLNHPDTALLLLALGVAWVLLIVFMGLTVPFLLTLLGSAMFVAVSLALDRSQAAWAFGGIGLLTFTFVLLTRAALILLSWPGQIISVAHTTIREASRIKIGLVFIIGLLLLLPILPMSLDSDSPLRYQVQTFISRSMFYTYVFAAMMTLFFTCASVAFEIRDRQIWQLMTKPLSRINYLLGKWAGVMTINLILLIVAGVSIFTFTQYLSDQPVASTEAGQIDRLAVQEQVLTARVPTMPKYPSLDAEQLRARVEEKVLSDPDLAAMGVVSLARRRAMAVELQSAYMSSQRTIPPQMAHNYVFDGLSRAKQLGSPLTLTYRFHILRDDEHLTFPVNFMFNGNQDTIIEQKYIPTMTHTLLVPSEYIREDGTLMLTIGNMYSPPPSESRGSLHFETDGLELLYRAGNFEMNFVRAVMVTWIKLSFLAALAICCSTFLSFPVACLATFTIFIAGTLGPYLADSLSQWYPKPAQAVEWSNIPEALVWVTRTVTRAIAQFLVFTLSGFGGYKPASSLVEGKLISWAAVLRGGFRIGVIWSGLAMFVGYMVMRSRQLAIYSGQG